MPQQHITCIITYAWTFDIVLLTYFLPQLAVDMRFVRRQPSGVLDTEEGFSNCSNIVYLIAVYKRPGHGGVQRLVEEKLQRDRFLRMGNAVRAS